MTVTKLAENELVPPDGLVKRKSDGRWVIDKRIYGHRLYKSTGTKDLKKAIEIYNQQMDGKVCDLTRIKVSADWDRKISDAIEDRASWLHRTYSGIFCRGRKKGCTISKDAYIALLRRSNGFCEVTGIALDLTGPINRRANPYGPSIDRIDSAQGYHLANCRIVCYAVNIAMGTWGEEVLIRVAKAFLLKSLTSEVKGPETAFIEPVSAKTPQNSRK
jgi:hypothetical protein